MPLSRVPLQLSHRPLQALEGHNKVSPQPSLLQAEQPQLSHPFLLGEVFQTSDHLHGHPLDPLQRAHVLLMLGAPEPNAVLQYSGTLLFAFFIGTSSQDAVCIYRHSHTCPYFKAEFFFKIVIVPDSTS